MSVGIGIIGLSQSGRTSVFDALTGCRIGHLPPSKEGANIGTAKVPDERLENLRKLFTPKKFTPAEVRYIEISDSVKNISGNLLNQLSSVDALMNVVRAFEADSVPHPEGSIDMERDMEMINLEVLFSDMAIVEKRLEKINSKLKCAKPTERQNLTAEAELLNRIRAKMEDGVAIREMELAEVESHAILGYQFLSAKPMLTIINIGENQIPESAQIEQRLTAKFGRAGHSILALSAKLEQELAELDSESFKMMCEEYGINRSGSGRVIQASFELLNLSSFFTVGPDEVRAWPITKGTPAVKAAGKVHSDIERGFIRAEVIKYKDLLEHKTIAEAKKHGLLRLEGKNYTVEDGDVINYLFNV